SNAKPAVQPMCGAPTGSLVSSVARGLSTPAIKPTATRIRVPSCWSVSSVCVKKVQCLQNQLVGERGQLGHLAGAWFGNDRYRRRVVERLARIRGEHGAGWLER